MDLPYAIERLERRILPYTFGVYGRRSNRMPQIVGSAFMLRVRDQDFIVTAAHVLRANQTSNLFVGSSRLNPIEGGKIFRSDDVDLAVIRVHPDLHGAIAGIARVRVDQVDVDDMPASAILYTFTGYPASRNKFDLRAKQMRNEPHLMTGASVPYYRYRELHIRPETHVAIEYDQSESHELRSTNIAAPAPQGMSGGAVWRVGSGHDLAYGVIGERLIGVGIEHRNNTLVGFRIAVVFAIVANIAPELKPYVPQPRNGKINIR